MVSSVSRLRYRSIFISDIHLGARACRAEAILAFLDGVTCEKLYLLGDIVDGWRLQRRWYWPAAHAEVLERLLDLARDGVEVVYIPGNHDAFARGYCGLTAAGVTIREEDVHVAADGRRYLLAHGDAYDPKRNVGSVSKIIGDLTYRGLMRLDSGWRAAASRLGFGEPSLAAWAKRHSSVAKTVVRRFEASLAAEARRRGLDGVICGHIHSAAAYELDGVSYVNCGDWVESLTAVAEGFDGGLGVLRRRPETGPISARSTRAMSAEPAFSA